MERIDIAIIGAGPYGLSAAAFLRDAGREPRVFGEPMRFWKTQTPAGMFLRSPYLGSDIGDPRSKLRLTDHERVSGRPISTPVPVERFLEYGDWFQASAVADVDPRDVRSVERVHDGFHIGVDGDTYHASRVVVASGVGNLAARPPEFRTLPARLVSHTFDHHKLDVFAKQRVAIVGGGQSALESAALLHEAGADVEVLVRKPFVRWLSEASWKHTTWPVNQILYAPPDVGPAGVSQLVARPDVFRRAPRRLQERMAARSVRPAGAGWLRPRLAAVPIRLGVEVRDARPSGARLHLRLSDGTEQEVDHLLLATGYRVDLSKYAFLDAELVRGIQCVDGYPRLSPSFETSVARLHVVGAPAAWSFGPLMRFVAGSGFAGRSLARGLGR